MNFVKKIISIIKNVFIKKDEIKKLEEPKNVVINKKDNFINSLKISTTEEKEEQDVETLICYGDGLGINTKIDY